VVADLSAGDLFAGLPAVGNPEIAQSHNLTAANLNTEPASVSATAILISVALSAENVVCLPPQLGTTATNSAFGRSAVYGVSDGVSAVVVPDSKNSVEVRFGSTNYAVVVRSGNSVEVLTSENAA
jgi:hypothetical protein